jgi:hypothetical protein
MHPSPCTDDAWAWSRMALCGVTDSAVAYLLEIQCCDGGGSISIGLVEDSSCGEIKLKVLDWGEDHSCESDE